MNLPIILWSFAGCTGSFLKFNGRIQLQADSEQDIIDSSEDTEDQVGEPEQTTEPA